MLPSKLPFRVEALHRYYPRHVRAKISSDRERSPANRARRVFFGNIAIRSTVTAVARRTKRDRK